MIFIRFGKRVEPFVDEYLVDTLENVTFRKTEPIDRGQVLSFDQPWENPGSLANTVFDDGKSIKIYYRGFPLGTHSDASELQTACIAESSDGYKFERTAVNEIEYNGIKQNNIVMMSTHCHNFAPFYDTNPNCPEDERYKAIGGIREIGGIYLFVSPDGIHWRDPIGKPVITRGDFDSMNTAFWDPYAEVYRCYARFVDSNLITGKVVRAIQSCYSTDFIHWSRPECNLYKDGITDQLYTNATRPMPGAEHILVSIPMRFQEERMKFADYDGNPHGSKGVSDSVLMTSRDGLHWDRTLRDAWIAGSLSEHEWTQRCFITASGIIERGNDYHIYVEKNYMWEDDGMWLYTVPRLRLMGLHADGDGGRIKTKMLRFEENDIYLNYATSAYGYVKLTLYSHDGQVRFESGEIFGNEMSHHLHIDGLKSTVGYFVIEMNEATVYAIGSDMSKK